MNPMKIYLLLFSIMFIACRNGKVKDEEYVNRIVNQWVGKEVVFPKHVVAAVWDRDTVCDELLKKTAKILVYVDSIGCTACKLNLYDWKQKIDSFSNYTDLGFLFFVSVRRNKAFTNRVKSEAFGYPIFYDPQNELEKMNRFPKDNHFQTFLLDSTNKVVLVGTPLGNPAMWNLYVREIKRLTKNN